MRVAVRGVRSPPALSAEPRGVGAAGAARGRTSFTAVGLERAAGAGVPGQERGNLASSTHASGYKAAMHILQQLSSNHAPLPLLLLRKPPVERQPQVSCTERETFCKN